MKTTTLELEEEERLERQSEDPEAPPVASIKDDAELDARAPEHEKVCQLAYRYWQERGCPDGSPEDDWYRAERDLRGGAA